MEPRETKQQCTVFSIARDNNVDILRGTLLADNTIQVKDRLYVYTRSAQKTTTTKIGRLLGMRNHREPAFLVFEEHALPIIPQATAEGKQETPGQAAQRLQKQHRPLVLDPTTTDYAYDGSTNLMKFKRSNIGQGLVAATKKDAGKGDRLATLAMIGIALLGLLVLLIAYIAYQYGFFDIGTWSNAGKGR